MAFGPAMRRPRHGGRPHLLRHGRQLLGLLRLRPGRRCTARRLLLPLLRRLLLGGLALCRGHAVGRLDGLLVLQPVALVLVAAVPVLPLAVC